MALDIVYNPIAATALTLDANAYDEDGDSVNIDIDSAALFFNNAEDIKKHIKQCCIMLSKAIHSPSDVYVSNTGVKIDY